MNWKKKDKDEERRRRRRDIFDRFFSSDIDDEFERMRRQMDRLFRNFLKEGTEPLREKPFVYGFSMRVGPEGKPQIKEFGDRLRPGKGISEITEREPLTDVIEGKKEVSITVELPGIAKKDIDLDADEESLTINVDTKERKYHKHVSLPCKVKPETTKATYKNGVLDIVIKRAKPEKERKGRRIKIE